jgi:hypothetical protein
MCSNPGSWFNRLCAMLLVLAAGCKSGGCPKNAWRDPKGRVCLKALSGLEPNAEQEMIDGSGTFIEFHDAKGWPVNFSVDFRPKESFDSEVSRMEVFFPGDTTVEPVGPAQGGEGKFNHVKSSNGFHRMRTVLKGGDFVATCLAMWFEKAEWPESDGNAEWGAACKSMAIPKR